MGRVAGVRQGSGNILACQARIVGQNLVFGLTSRKKFQDELDGLTRPSDHGFAGHDIGIDGDAL